MSFDLLNCPLAFSLPQVISNQTAWAEHIPFAFTIVPMARPRVLVELGTHQGDSYLAFCQAVDQSKSATRCYAVDTWRGDEHTGPYDESIYASLKEYHDARYVNFSQLMRMEFGAAADEFADGVIDLLHIDGRHTYEAVKHDFETWRPKLSDAAIVLFHDTSARLEGFGVWQLWEELSKQHRAFEFPHGSGLGVLAVGKSIPPAVAEFFDAAEQRPDAIRQAFASLGHHVAMWRLALTVGQYTTMQINALDQWRRQVGHPPLQQVTVDQFIAHFGLVMEQVTRDVVALANSDLAQRKQQSKPPGAATS